MKNPFSRLIIFILVSAFSFILNENVFIPRNQSISSTSFKNKKIKILEVNKLENAGKKEKFDEPDKFAEYFRNIRTKEGKLKPDYKPDYKLTELKNAKERNKFLSKSANTPFAALPWVERGPANVGGRTRGIIYDPDDLSHKTWFVGSVGGGIWKTTDAGVTWTIKTPDFPNMATTTLAMAASNHNVIYAGTGEGFFNVDAIEGDGIFKSTDKGETWSRLSSTAGDADFHFINRLIVNPDNENVVLAVTNSGVLKSTDGGNTWTKVYSSSNRVQDIVANPLNFNTLYATVNGIGVIKSTNSGNNWVNSSSGISGVRRMEIDIAPTDTNRLYISAQVSTSSSNTNTSKFFMSSDAGSTWINVPENSGNTIDWLGGQGWYDNTIAVDPYDEKIVFVGGIDIWRVRIISGTSITKFSNAITDGYNQYSTGTKNIHVDKHDMTIIPIDQATNKFWIINGNDGGVAYSTDSGNNWKETDQNGYNTSQFYGIDKKPGANEYFGGMQDNGTWKSPPGTNANAATQYIFQLGGDGFNVEWNYNDGNKLIGGSQFNRFFRSEDNGNSWEAASFGFDDWGNSSNSPFISKLANSKSDPDLIFTLSRSGVWRSDNFGASWTLTGMPASFDDGSYFSQSQVAVSLADPQVVWAGAGMTSTRSLQVSTDGGLSFNPANNFSNMGRISGFATHPRNSATAYALFSFAGLPKILRTTDFGNSWEDISGYASGAPSTNGFPDVAVYSLLVMPYDTNKIWAGTEIGIVESIDNGTSWHLADNGFPSVSVWNMKIVDDQIVVATHGRGIWSVTLPELAGYKPPVVTLTPRINGSINQGITGININASLRSEYDSTHVLINNQIALKFGNTMVKDTSFSIPVTQAGVLNVQLESFRNGRTYKSGLASTNVTQLLPVQSKFITSFSNLSDEFQSDGFDFITLQGFNNEAAHTQHPYNNTSNLILFLKVPIIVASSNATLKYDDIAIVEPGDAGSVFGDNNFWDYVIVEGSNGNGWLPLIDGYDSRADSKWLDAFNNNSTVDSSMFKSHTINLLNTFNAGDTILIRFRLFSDQFVTGWGWAIDNLAIQDQFVGVEDEGISPLKFNLNQNYPNPFNPATTIQYTIANVQTLHATSQRATSQRIVQLKVYDVLGREVAVLVNKKQSPGNYEVKFNGENLPSGIYFYKLQYGSFHQTRKMILLK